MPRSESIWINLRKISAVHSASSTARWWFFSEICSSFATVSSLNRFNPGSRYRAIDTVSTTVNAQSSPRSSQFFWINPMSNSALCATITHPLQNSINSGRTCAISGSPTSISSRIFVSSSMANGSGTSGFTNWEKRSTILPSETFTAPISIILCTFGLRPVVSKSNTTYESERLCPFGANTICFKSSTRYASTP